MRTRFCIRDKHQRMGGLGSISLSRRSWDDFPISVALIIDLFGWHFLCGNFGGVVDSPFVPWPSDMQTRRRTPELKDVEKCIWVEIQK